MARCRKVVLRLGSFRNGDQGSQICYGFLTGGYGCYPDGMTDHIQLVRDGAVLEVALSRPAKKNALTSAMYHAMTVAMAEATSDPTVRVILLHGVGDAFCAGNDLEDFLAGPEASESALAFIKELAQFDKPIVVAVQGMAIGVGTTMLFHCDLVYASPDARFVMPFVDLGLVPEAGSSLLAPLRLGHAKAAAMLLLGEPLGAGEADAAGLVTAVVPAGDLLVVARKKAHALAAKPYAALTATRGLMKLPAELLTNRMNEEAHLFAEALISQDAQEAFNAFLEKRPPILAVQHPDHPGFECPRTMRAAHHLSSP